MRQVNSILYKEVKSNIGSVLTIVCLMLLIVGFDVIAPWPFKILIDNVLNPNPIENDGGMSFLLHYFPSRDMLGLFVVFVYFLSTFLLANIEYIRSIITKKVIKSLTGDFSKHAFQSLQSLAIGFYKKQQIGDYIYRLSYDVSALGDLLEAGILPLVTSSLYLLFTATIMLLINVQLTLLSFLVLPFLAIGLYSFNAYIAHATKRSEFFNSAAFSFIEEALTHLKIIQAFSQEHRESHAFDEKVDVSLKNDVILYRLDFLLTLLVGIIIAISYSVIILYGIRAVFAGTLTTGLLIVFIFYLDNLTNPILSVIYAVTGIKQSYVKIIRMEDFFAKRTHLTDMGNQQRLDDTTITFRNVTLRAREGTEILHNVSFEIEPNKRTIIFGVNGSGKTSVINLLLRFVDKPTSGDIYIGGINIQDYNLKVLRDSIAFVPQEITLFNDTVRHNIAFGSHANSIKEIREAAKAAVADEFIRKLPGGYNFHVGEGGNFLSGGQRQRLMLARALMKKQAKILLFDETLSALDVKSRKEVLHNLYHFSQGKTTILVSNIFAVVSAADNIIVLHKGRLIYSGPSHKLTKEVLLYKLIVDHD